MLLPLTIAIDHPRYFAFIPSAPTPASAFVDAAAERRLGLRRLVARGGRRGVRREPGPALARRLLRPPADRRWGASCRAARVGNLSALRRGARARAPRCAGGGGAPPGGRWKIVCSAEAHSSIASAARVMDVERRAVAADDDGRMLGDALRAALEPTASRLRRRRHRRLDQLRHRRRRRLDRRAQGEFEFWLHVDGAYGLAASSRRSPATASPGGAGRLGDRRPAQVAVRAVRLRARLSTAIPSPAAARTPRRRSTSTPSPKTSEWSPSDYAVASHPARPRPAVLVLARRPRHRGLRGRGRARAPLEVTRAGRGGDPRPRRARATSPSRSCRSWPSGATAGPTRTTTAGRPGCARPAPRSCSRRRCGARRSPGSRS